MQQRLQPRNSGALVFRFQHDPVATQRKSNHQTVSAMTRRKDIIKGIRGEGKMLEYSWHFLSDFCSSGIVIETFGRVASLAGRGKAVSVGISCSFSLSSFCTNRGRSCVCFHGRRSRKTERDEQKWQMESAQNDTWRCAKHYGSSYQHKINCPGELLVSWVTPALELQNHVLSAELINICIRIMGLWWLSSQKSVCPKSSRLFWNWNGEKNLWSIRNRNGAVQNVVSDSFLIYSALKTQRLENPMEQPGCRADTKHFQSSDQSIKISIGLKILLNKWKTVNLRNPTHGMGRVAVGAVQNPGILLCVLAFLFLESKEW